MKPDEAEFITKARVTELHMSDGVWSWASTRRAVLASWRSVPVLRQWRIFVPILPSILFSPSTVQACQHLLATNSEHCTGVGIKMGAAIGAKTTVLVWVHVNRTVREDEGRPLVAERTLVAVNELVYKLAGGCTTQASEWKKRQRLRAEDFVTVHVSSSCCALTTVSSCSRWARALLSLSPGSARVNLISMVLSGKNVDSPKSCP